jgi:hypothetical protein
MKVSLEGEGVGATLKRGRGECRVPAAPAASRAKLEVSTRASSPQVHRIHPAFPHAMVLTAYFALSPVIGLDCHRHLRIKARPCPVGPALPPQT